MIRLSIILIFIAEFCFAQTEFTKTYYNSGKHVSGRFIELPDTGFLLYGTTNYSFTNPNTDHAFLMRTDKYGDSLWTKDYGCCRGGGMDKINDSTVIVTGDMYNQNGWGVMTEKLSIYGDTLEHREYALGGSGNIHKCTDNGFVVSSNYAYDYGYLKLDSMGNVQWHNWHNMIGGCWEFKEDIYGGYIAVGSNYQNVKDYIVNRLDSNGSTIWFRTYGNNLIGNNYYAADVLVMQDSNYLVACAGLDWSLMKLDRLTGDTIWTRYFACDSTPNASDGMFAIAPAGNNRYICLTGEKVRLLNSNGDTIWTKRYPFSIYGSRPYYVLKTSDGGFAYTSTITSWSQGYQIIAFVKIDSLGNTLYTSIFNPPNNFQPITIYPNPASDKLYINAGSMDNEKKLVFSLTDLQGRSVLNGQYEASQPIDVSTLPGGIYIATLKGKEKEVRGKVIIQR